MNTTHTLTFCADDYGLAPGVSDAIRRLIAQRRLHATSCMAGSDYWPQAAIDIAPLADLADIGLHITLTDQTPLTKMRNTAPNGKLPSIKDLIIGAHMGRLDQGEIRAEIMAQVDRFIAHRGCAPDYLDGHQHCHTLPFIRDVVIDVWQGPMQGMGWVRNCWESPLGLMTRKVDWLRALIIGSLGLGLLDRMNKRGIPHNRSFRGVYDLTDRQPFADLVERFIEKAPDHTLIMVHPGFVDEALKAADPVTDQREREFAYLSSDTFAQLLDRQGLRLSKLFA